MLFKANTLMTANGTAEPLEGDNILGQRWKDRVIPFPGVIELGIIATTVGVVVSILSGPETLLEESNVSGGGVIGVFPIFPDQIELEDEVAAGDLIKVRYRETLAATPSVMMTLRYTPA